MEIKDIHQNPEFQEKKRAYFRNFMMGHLAQARLHRDYGLLVEDGSKGWRNVVKHQLLSAVMTETISELIGRSSEETEKLTKISLTHDVDKRRQNEGLSKKGVIEDELKRSQWPLVATTSNFTGFPEWGIDEYILRYVDSSIGEKNPGHWYGARDPNNLPPIVIVPWRDRVRGFKESKQEEGERGRILYDGMTTWDKLQQIMKIIETNLYEQIIVNNPDLVQRYPDPAQLTQLVEDRIHQKILNS